MARPAFVPVLHGAARDRPDEEDTLIAAEAVAGALARLGFRTDVVHLGLDFAAIDRLVAGQPDCVFNLVEAIDGDAGLAHIAPALLEHHGLRYTGASAGSWRTLMSKPAVKDRLIAAGLPTPSWSSDGYGFDAGDRVIVKSLVEHASFGIDAASVVPADRAPQEIAAREARFGGTFFAEAFIEGREFNISVIEGATGPIVLPPAEIEFIDFPAGRPRIVDYEAKWLSDSAAFENTPRTFDFPPADQPLLAEVRALSSAAWELFQLEGYARVDFRVDAEGRPWILEVNLNPCLTPDAGFIAAAGRAGYGFDEMIARIVDVAVKSVRLAV